MFGCQSFGLEVAYPLLMLIEQLSVSKFIADCVRASSIWFALRFEAEAERVSDDLDFSSTDDE